MQAAGLKQGDQALPVDERRLGLQGQVRRVWCSRGVKVVQKLQFVFEWVYLILAVNPMSGAVKWAWIERMRQEHIIPVLQQWQLHAVIWDGASAHRGKETAKLPVKRIFQPPYSPEVNPVERVFQELRRAVEGRIYPTLEAKMQAVEVVLGELASDPERVKQLVGWDWIQVAFERLPTS